VVLDLGRWAGRRVDLLLAVEAATATPVAAGPPGRAGWGSPEVWSRRAAPAAAPAARDGRPNIVLIGADTLRADAVGPRPGRASLTPALDRLAAESDVWPDAYTCFNITNPSFASILTGLYGKNHGVYDLHTRLPAEHSTLPELLARAGYRTLAVIAARHLGDHNSGLAQGFGTVLTAAEHDAAELAATSAMDWIDQAAEPFFVWLHLFDPHTPHTPPAPFALGYRAATASGLAPATGWTPFRPPGPRTFAEPVLGAHADLYDGEVAYLDRQVDRLLGFLASRGLLERTLVVFVADHGENLGEHGIRFRHVGLFTTTTHVPLVVRWPGAAGTGRRRAGLVQTIDLFPTLLRAAGVAVPPSDGVDLDVLTGDGRRGRRAVFAEHGNGSGAMVRTATHAYATSRGNPLLPDGPSLFDLAADPAETRNLAGSGLAVEAELARLLAAWQADRRALRGEARPHALQPEEAERLRSLGYLQ
jgi:arylsulfatase A-like enzyme